jgi:hypothetical protein
MLYVLSWLMHHDKSVWGETAEEFCPERFLSAETVQLAYMLFSKITRDCIALTLAYLEVRPLGWQKLILGEDFPGVDGEGVRVRSYVRVLSDFEGDCEPSVEENADCSRSRARRRR